MMPVLLREPPDVIVEWLDRRRALGQDGYDEMWDGVLHVAAPVHGRHGRMQHELAMVLRDRVVEAGSRGSGPVNLGRPHDYRGADGFVAAGASALLGVTAGELHDTIEWPT